MHGYLLLEQSGFNCLRTVCIDLKPCERGRAGELMRGYAKAICIGIVGLVSIMVKEKILRLRPQCLSLQEWWCLVGNKKIFMKKISEQLWELVTQTKFFLTSGFERLKKRISASEELPLALTT